jgi:Ser-tRNA(Ala) deacylase AlaX
MTRKVFWEDPYQTRIETTISGVNGAEVTVAETICYAFSGGQERDTGTIGGRIVREARKDGLEIVYTLDPDHGLNVGDPVVMEIDGARRYRLMRLHFAAEIILELVYQTLGPIQKIGAHIAEDKARIDFEWGENIAAAFPDLLARAGALIAADHPISSAYQDEATEQRTWEIAGFARVACGGTHLKTTGEVGPIALKRKNVGKGKERIEITLT